MNMSPTSKVCSIQKLLIFLQEIGRTKAKQKNLLIYHAHTNLLLDPMNAKPLFVRFVVSTLSLRGNGPKLFESFRFVWPHDNNNNWPTPLICRFVTDFSSICPQSHLTQLQYLSHTSIPDNHVEALASTHQPYAGTYGERVNNKKRCEAHQQSCGRDAKW